MIQTDIGYKRGWLDSGAAASLNRVDTQIGHPLDINEAGRTYEQQAAHYENYLRNGSPIALAPWTPSIHQLGNAIDTDEQLVALLAENGWVQTVFRNGVLVEPWHFEYSPTRDQHIDDQPDITEDSMALRVITSPYYRSAGMQVVHNGLAATAISNNEALDLRQGGVASHDYNEEYKFNNEISRVWNLGKLVSTTAAEAMTAEFGERLS